MKTKNMNMTVGNPLRLLFFFALPLMVGNVFQQMYTVVDTAIIGQGVGLQALAALGTVDWPNWMLFSIATGFAQGISVKVSQKFGEGDLNALPSVLGQGVLISAITAVLISLFAVFGFPWMLRMMLVPEDLQPIARLYSTTLFAFFPISVFYNFTSAMLRAVGDSKTPLYAMVIASITNILLDSLFVFIFKWGVAGAAGATVFSQGVAGTFCFIKMRKTPVLRFSMKDVLHFNRPLAIELFKLSAPMSGMNLLIAFGGLLVMAVVNSFGVSFIAGYTATNKMYGVLEIAAISYGYSITTYVGQNFGAANAERISSGVRTAVFLSIATALLFTVFIWIFSYPLIGLFLSSEDELVLHEATEAAVRFLRLMGSWLPVLYLLHTFRSALQGMGYTFLIMLSGILEFAARVILALIAGALLWPDGTFYAEIFAWIFSVVFLVSCYYVKRRKLPEIFRQRTNDPSKN